MSENPTPGKGLQTLFLHVGSHKTGTSSIQQSFFRSAAALKRHGAMYFQYGANHSVPFIWLFSEKRKQYHTTLKLRLSEKELNDRIKDVEKRLRSFLSDQSCQTKIISGEDISSFSRREIESIKKYFDETFGQEIKIIIYIRNYYEYLDSRVQERVKNGASLRAVTASLDWPPHRRDAAWPLYRFRIEKFIKVFGAENVDVRVFDSKLFKGGDLLADFTDAIKMPELFNDLPNVRANTSISAESVRILSRYNELFPVQLKGGYNPARAEKVKSYFATSGGTKFRVTDAELLAGYDRLISEDKEYIREILDKDLAAYVVHRKEMTPEVLSAENASLDIERIFQGLGRIFRDVESCQTALDITLMVLSGDESQAAHLAAIAGKLRFVTDDQKCRQVARGFMRNTKFEYATLLMQRAMELRPDNAENHAVTADIMARQQDWASAEQAYQRAIVLDPTKAAIYRKLSKCLFNLGRAEEATRAALKAEELAPGNEENQGTSEELPAASAPSPSRSQMHDDDR